MGSSAIIADIEEYFGDRPQGKLKITIDGTNFGQCGYSEDLFDFFYRIEKTHLRNLSEHDYRLQQEYKELEKLDCRALRNFSDNEIGCSDEATIATFDFDAKAFYMGVLFSAPYSFDDVFIAVLPLGENEKVCILDDRSCASLYLEVGTFIASFMSLQNLVVRASEHKEHGDMVVQISI